MREGGGSAPPAVSRSLCLHERPYTLPAEQLGVHSGKRHVGDGGYYHQIRGSVYDSSPISARA